VNRWLSLFLVLGLPALGQTLTQEPTLVHPVEARFPEGRVDAGVGATVLLSIDIGADGTVTDAKVLSAPQGAFDDAALEAARQLVFTPAQVDGQPAPVRIQFKTEFAWRAPPAPEPVDAGAPSVTVRGRLLSAGKREPVVAASITAGEHDALSDAQGQFELTGLPPGEAKLKVVAPGFEVFESTEALVVGERTEVTYFLRAASGFETVVRESRERREVSQVKLAVAEMKMIPGTNNDAFRVVQNLPGVARSPFGGSAFIVRGSKAWDSRIYVDEIEIPQLFHFGGLTATVNSNTLERIGFQPGNFGADYGRSIGGLVEAEVRTPSKSGLHGYADVNVFDASALVEAPLSADWSVSASGRYGFTQAVVPWALKTFAPDAAIGFALAPQSWDYQVRAERRVGSSKNRLFIAVFGASDRWALLAPNVFVDQDFEGGNSSAGNSELYNRLVVGLDQRLTDRLTFVSRNAVGFDINEQNGSVQEIFFHTQQVPVQLRERFKLEVPEANLNVGFGFDGLVTPVTFDAQEPPVFKANQLPDPYVTRRLIAQTEHTVYVQPGLFADATWAPFKWLQVRGGARVDGELAVMKKAWVNPRLGVRVAATKDLAFKLGVGLYQQPPDYRSGELSPVFGNPGLLPEGAWHFAAGGEYKLFDFIELDVQGYYKALFNQARQTLESGDGSDISIPGAESRYSSTGYGRAYGLEAMVRIRPTKRFVGWVAYSLSRFERDYYGGVAYAPGPLDQPHNLIAVASVSLPYNFTVGARFRFTSGPLVTPVLSSIFDANANQYVALPGLPWSQRLANFGQLDLRVDRRWVFDRWSLSAYADVQNVTNRKNPEALTYNFNYTKSAVVSGVPILPTVGLRGEF
jgi:TonB family protein